MTDSVPFPAAADGVINNTQAAIDKLVDALDDNKVLDNRDELASWLKAYISLARIAHNAGDEGIDIRGSQVYDLLTECDAYRPNYHFMNIPDHANNPVPAKAYLDTAISELVKTLGNKQPIHPDIPLGQIDEYQARSKEEGTLYTETEYFGHDCN